MPENLLKPVTNRNYLARDFDGFRAVLLEYAKQNYPDKMQDFSEAGSAGMFLDFPAWVGDNLSFYLDHLFNELHSDTVVETGNIERILKNSGVPIAGAAGSSVLEDFYIEVPVSSDGSLLPEPSLIPTLLANATVQSDTGVTFTLLADVDFWEIVDGQIKVAKDVSVTNGRRINGIVVSKILKKSGLIYSGETKTDSFTLGSFVPFRRLQLSQPNVTSIESVTDDLGNVYYHVNSLTHNVVYKGTHNSRTDFEDVPEDIKMVPAPYRFTTEVSLSNRKTTLIMGGGTADDINDDVLPDPSDFALSLPFGQSFSRIPVNPQKLLKTTTLGVSAINTTLSVKYKYGGGLSHNCSANSIRNVVSAEMYFPANPSQSLQAQVLNSLEVKNSVDASGGDDALSKEELLSLVPVMKNSQERIATASDMLARVYTMPSNFGRVFRAQVGKNPDNPLATRLYVISRNSSGNLVPCPDSLKINLKKYLREYRMTSDAIDIMDAAIINLELKFSVIAHPTMNKSLLLQNIISDLKNAFDVRRNHIGKPIVLSDVINLISQKTGVLSVDTVEFKNITGSLNNRTYSSFSFDVQTNTKNGIIYPVPGSIFEIKYTDANIIGKCV